MFRNPGTGKTTVAKLYGLILADLGLLSKGDVVLTNSSDFIGSALGTSENQTRGIIHNAQGCVLIIDEAYSLNPSVGVGSSGGGDPYKTAVIDTIVEQVQGVPGEDIAVVMLGYRKQMEAFLAAANPGLSRRFQMENALVFHDYDDSSLVRILRKKCQKDQIDISLETANYAVKMLAKAKAQPNFGNAGAVNNILSKATLAMSLRNGKYLIPEDFGIIESGNEEDIFEGLVGCDKVLEKLKEYRATISLCKRDGKNPKQFIEYNYVFAGSPGTGKTTVARRMGKLFYNLQLLPCADVIEVSASDLTTGYAGQAGKKTYDMLTKARGKVLFIDEAYQLNPRQGGAYMQEVVDELVKGLTSEEFKQKILVILAGYEDDMNKMLAVNQGLRSRFSEKLIFDDFPKDLVIEMFLQKMATEDRELSTEASDALPELIVRLMNAPYFGNGRDIENLVKKTIRSYAKRITSNVKDMEVNELKSSCIDVLDISDALENLLTTKVGKDPMIQDSNNDNDVKKINADLPMETLSENAISLSTLKNMETISLKVSKKEDMITSSNEDSSDLNNILPTLQFLLDSLGLNSEKGIDRLTNSNIDSDEMNLLAQEIAKSCNLSIETARELLRKWQAMQLDVKEQVKKQQKEMELAKAQNRKALVPIWRCGVCGQADKPYIACYVAPFIVRYDELTLTE